ncbi:CDP-glycerol glycerophosphotransferase family protein [Siminovitchia fordii]|uniref:CDP-glycerol glycerophosphotransferase family protein n=1 Tax=Siminovitchia fordii TaxID=254759 RepID=UPI00036CFB2D|nr:CDP-glycerol glycerophosphotransferase family protein [Siminovitchia fordii]
MNTLDTYLETLNDEVSLIKVFDTSLEVFEYNDQYIEVFFQQDNKLITTELSLNNIDMPKAVHPYETADKLLLMYQPNPQNIFFMYVKNNMAYAVLENVEIKNNFRSNDGFNYKINNFYDEKVQLVQYGSSRLVLKNTDGEAIFFIEDFLTEAVNRYGIHYDAGFTTIDFRYTVIATANYDIYNIVIIYDLFRKEFQIQKVLLTIERKHDEIDINLIDNNSIEIRNKFESIEINFKKLIRGKKHKLFNIEAVHGAKKQNILCILYINKVKYYIYTSTNYIFIMRGSPYKVTGHHPNLKVFLTKKHVILAGRYTHYAHQAKGVYESLYLHSNNHKLGNFVRPFKSIKFLQRFGYFKVPIESLIINDKIHNNLYVGDNETIIHNLRRKHKDKKAKTLAFKKWGKQLLVLRTNLNGNLTVTLVPFSEEYTLTNRIKINFAKLFAKIFPKRGRNTNLYFEKKSERADESGFRVFEKVMSHNPRSSENFYIINKNSDKYVPLKEKYGNRIIKKYSFKHYLNIFRANYFISSELSNHLLNDRLYIDSIRSKIMSVPLIFLQHGIMFAKPVDNPMAFGFHKGKNLYNMYKSVISSQLEANEFYKMGYDDRDLILTGLATLDYAYLDKDADKIVYMPTYRYWEESLVYNNNIEKTSYYKSIMKIVDSFEERGLIDRLLIVPHNKFSEFIYENMPKYKHIISKNPTDALKKGRIFITDYSSAIYDGIFRGAYPIFYWEEKDYLIQNYKAIPPVNDGNAPGPIAYSSKELMNLVQKAIDQNYFLEKEYQEKYLKINEFNDRKNTERIVNFLKDENII